MNPNLTITITILERLNEAAAESSAAWNNAGTGHSAFCELNYTPERPDGSINISQAPKIAEQFEESKQFWAFLTEHYQVQQIQRFINLYCAHELRVDDSPVYTLHASKIWADRGRIIITR